MEESGFLSGEEGFQETDTVECTADVPCTGYRQLENQEALDFIRQYPDLNPQEIPREVWQAVGKGTLLAEAYGHHERGRLQARNRELEQQLAVAQANARGRTLSLGSMRSNGRGRDDDAFMAGFDEA